MEIISQIEVVKLEKTLETILSLSKSSSLIKESYPTIMPHLYDPQSFKIIHRKAKWTLLSLIQV